jgi:biopolymer transport protein ExbD
MASQLSGDNEDAIASINVTPFVDIILVVLIIFMVTTPIIMKPSINVNLPKSASGDEATKAPLNITIDAKGSVFLNNQPIDEANLTVMAKAAVATKPDTQAVIAADKDVPHGKVIAVIDAIKTGGVHKFAISIDKKKN